MRKLFVSQQTECEKVWSAQGIPTGRSQSGTCGLRGGASRCGPRGGGQAAREPPQVASPQVSLEPGGSRRGRARVRRPGLCCLGDRGGSGAGPRP